MRRKLSLEERMARKDSHLKSLAIRRVVDSAFRTSRKNLMSFCGYSVMESKSFTSVEWTPGETVRIPTYSDDNAMKEHLESLVRIEECRAAIRCLSNAFNKIKKERANGN